MGTESSRIDCKMKIPLGKATGIPGWFTSGEKSLRGSRFDSDFWWVLFGVCLSGNQAFTTDGRLGPILIVTMLLLAIRLHGQGKCFLTNKLHLSILIFCGIFLVQAASFNLLPVRSIIGFFIRLFVGYALIRSVENFSSVYVKVMTCVAIVSLIFYIPEQLFFFAGGDLKQYFLPLRQAVGVQGDFNILIYNFDIPKEIHRNSGFFWEPGAFAGYLLMAITFLGLKGNKIDSKYKFCITCLSIALLTTMSTMGYLVFLVAFSMHYQLIKKYMFSKKYVFVFIGLIPVFLLLGVKAYKMEFIEDKIATQYERTVYQSGNWAQSRFGTLAFDWEYVKRRPLVGWGINEKTVNSLYGYGEVTGQGNGLSNSVRRFGFIGFFTWFAMTMRGYYRISGNHIFKSILGMAVVILMLNGENFFNFILIWGFMFIEQEDVSQRRN